jgi:hypothetical protein
VLYHLSYVGKRRLAVYPALAIQYTFPMLSLLVRTVAPVALALSIALSLASPSTAGAAKKVPCAKEKKAINAAPKRKKAKKRAAYKACMKRYQAAQLAISIKKQLVGHRLVGTRGDGVSVDWLFCAKGIKLKTGNAVISRTKWGVYNATGSVGKFRAIVREYADPHKGGLSVAVARTGSQYKVGVVSFSTDISDLGNVTRTADAAACAAL